MLRVSRLKAFNVRSSLPILRGGKNTIPRNLYYIFRERRIYGKIANCIYLNISRLLERLFDVFFPPFASLLKGARGGAYGIFQMYTSEIFRSDIWSVTEAATAAATVESAFPSVARREHIVENFPRTQREGLTVRPRLSRPYCFWALKAGGLVVKNKKPSHGDSK